MSRSSHLNTGYISALFGCFCGLMMAKPFLNDRADQIDDLRQQLALERAEQVVLNDELLVLHWEHIELQRLVDGIPVPPFEFPCDFTPANVVDAECVAWSEIVTEHGWSVPVALRYDPVGEWPVPEYNSVFDDEQWVESLIEHLFHREPPPSRASHPQCHSDDPVPPCRYSYVKQAEFMWDDRMNRRDPGDYLCEPAQGSCIPQ